MRHRRPPGRITGEISLHKVGPGTVHRIMRAEGFDGGGASAGRPIPPAATSRSPGKRAGCGGAAAHALARERMEGRRFTEVELLATADALRIPALGCTLARERGP